MLHKNCASRRPMRREEGAKQRGLRYENECTQNIRYHRDIDLARGICESPGIFCGVYGEGAFKRAASARSRAASAARSSFSYSSARKECASRESVCTAEAFSR